MCQIWGTFQKLESFKISHTALISSWNKRILNGDVSFSSTEIGHVYGKEIFDFKLPKGASLSAKTKNEDLFKYALKMVANYKYDEWKVRLKVKLSSKEGQQQKKIFMDGLTVSIFDYFYQMRIRSNYRDFAFIDGITSTETQKYFEIYYSSTIKLANAIIGLCKSMKVKRLK